MEIILFIVAVAFGIGAASDDTNATSEVVSHDKFQNYTPSKILVEPVNSFVIYSDKGYVISNADLVPTKKTKWVGLAVPNSQPTVVAHALGSKQTSQEKTGSKASQGENVCLKGSYKVFFDNDKYNLKPNTILTIAEAVKQANSCNTDTIYISGHATITGTIDHNIQLATNRANAVKDLVEKLTSFKVKVLNPLSAKLTIKPERFAVITLDE